MKKKLPGILQKSLLASVIFLVLFVLVNYKPATVLNNRMVFGELNLSNTDPEKGSIILEEKLSTPIYISLENKSRSITLKEIGIGINHEKLSKATKSCKLGAVHLLCTNNSSEEIDPADVITLDDSKMENFFGELDDELAFMAKNTIISFDNFTFRAVSNNATVYLDKEKLQNPSNIAELIGSKDGRLKLAIRVLDNIENQNNAAYQLTQNITYPLLIKYGRNPVYIPAEKVGEFILQNKNGEYTEGMISYEKVQEYLQGLKGEYGSDEVVITEHEAVDAIRRALLYRAADYQINNAVILPLEGSPRTHGELHNAYIEVIKSQQRAYRFEHGELVKTYIVSTGLTWETPPGEYKVLGKQKMTISYFGSWYMPYYLPIGTIDGYKFGFHEIPYHLDGAGNIYSRDPNTMGSPATGGCIQLTHDDAVELFEWAPVGLPVYIYE